MHWSFPSTAPEPVQLTVLVSKSAPGDETRDHVSPSKRLVQKGEKIRPNHECRGLF